MVVENVNGTELRFKYPDRLLVVVIAFVFWGVGLLDLLGHSSADPDVFGLYSLPLFFLIIVYGSALLLWLALFFNSNLLSRVVDGIRYIQNRTWLVLTLLGGLAIGLWLIFEWDRWSRFPGLQFTAFGMTVLAVVILLFSNWKDGRNQWWRRVIAYPLFFIFIIEAVFQVMAWFGLLPGLQTIGGDFVPYERIYYNAEGLRNDYANRYGWYFSDFVLEDEGNRILILGGSYVQGLQVQPEQQINVVLSGIVNQGNNENETQTEFISIGLPGFGLSPFLYDDSMTEFPNTIMFDEMIVLFHLGDDFQSPIPSHNSIRYTVGETNEVEVDPEDARVRHDLTHYFLRGYMSFQLVETLRSNYLTPKVIAGLVKSREKETKTTGAVPGNGEYDFPRLVGFVNDSYTLTEPGHAGIKATERSVISEGNNFMFIRGGNADTDRAKVIADNMLGTAQEIARANNITLRVVTIPVFPDAFYNSYPAGNWEPEVGGYDLFLPEQALVEIALKYDISILPMGQYMLRNGLTVEEIRSLYLSNEQGSFSSRGHEYFAQAIYSCFYSNQEQPACSE